MLFLNWRYYNNLCKGKKIEIFNKFNRYYLGTRRISKINDDWEYPNHNPNIRNDGKTNMDGIPK